MSGLEGSAGLPDLTRRQLLRGLGLGAAAAIGGAWPDLLAASSRARLGPTLQGSTGAVLVRGGTLVDAGGRARADVRVRDGKIAEIAVELSPIAGEEVVDAEAAYVLPGGIDPHVHLTQSQATPERFRFADDLASGSEAALAGGITTLGNMTFPGDDESLTDAVRRDASAIAERAIADVMLHPVVRDPEAALEELPHLVEGGHSSLKIFMVLAAFDEQTAAFLELMMKARDAGVLTLIHCEDRAIIDRATETLVAAGRTAFRYYAESRPVEAEVVATNRAVGYCQATGAPIYVVHLSSARALEICRSARGRDLPVYVETRPLYLHLTADRYAEPDGPLYVGQPPLRTVDDVAALWAGVGAGDIQTIGTDHVGWAREQKLDPSLDITDLRPGVNNLEVMLPMLLSEGVQTNRLSLERFVAVTSRNAARLFGLYPRKGTISIGADADLVVWDLEATRTVRASDLRSRAGYSVYEGTPVTGWPRTTIRRGAVVYDRGEVRASPGSGMLLRRGPTKGP